MGEFGSRCFRLPARVLPFRADDVVFIVVCAAVKAAQPPPSSYLVYKGFVCRFGVMGTILLLFLQGCGGEVKHVAQWSSAVPILFARNGVGWKWM